MNSNTQEFHDYYSSEEDHEDQLLIQKIEGLYVKLTEIAKIVGMTPRQLYLFRMKHDVRNVQRTVKDDELREAMMACICDSNGRFGSKMTHGMLRSRGIKVSLQRVCSMMRELDPEGVELRKTRPIKRRAYDVTYNFHIQVPQANVLKHIDGHDYVSSRKDY